MYHLSFFLGKDSKKSIFDKNKSKKNKNGTQQMPYMKKVELAKAKSKGLFNIYSLLKQSVK